MISTIEKDFDFDIKIIWDIITDFKKYHWRSDISKVDVLNEKNL